VYWGSPVRNFLELEIFPYFRANSSFQRILFVGLHKYTIHYHTFFNNKKEVKTIDIDPLQKEYAEINNHIVDSITNIDNYIKNEHMDLVFMNGVYGWGLNEKQDFVNALEKIHKILKHNGVVVFGWNEITQYDPLEIRKNDYFENYRPYVINGKSEVLIEQLNPKRHVYRYYEK
jgi:SAM-dependent methyltransferase